MVEKGRRKRKFEARNKENLQFELEVVNDGLQINQPWKIWLLCVRYLDSKRESKEVREVDNWEQEENDEHVVEEILLICGKVRDEE
jgi:hypothetical protein